MTPDIKRIEEVVQHFARYASNGSFKTHASSYILDEIDEYFSNKTKNKILFRLVNPRDGSSKWNKPIHCSIPVKSLHTIIMDHFDGLKNSPEFQCLYFTDSGGYLVTIQIKMMLEQFVMELKPIEQKQQKDME
jgi:hypothetical protein